MAILTNFWRLSVDLCENKKLLSLYFGVLKERPPPDSEAKSYHCEIGQTGHSNKGLGSRGKYFAWDLSQVGEGYSSLSSPTPAS